MIKQAEFFGRSVYLAAGVATHYGVALGICRRYRTLVLDGSALATVGLPSPLLFPRGGPIVQFINQTASTVDVVLNDTPATVIATIPAGGRCQIFNLGTRFVGRALAAGPRTFSRAASRPTITPPTVVSIPAIDCTLAKYKLVNCADEGDVLYTNANLSIAVGKIIITYQYPDVCYEVFAWNDFAETAPVAVAVAVDDVGRGLMFDTCTACLEPGCVAFDDPNLPLRLQWVNYGDLILTDRVENYRTNFDPLTQRNWTGGFVLDRSGGFASAAFIGDRYNDGTQPNGRTGRGLQVTGHPGGFNFFPTGTSYFLEMPTIQCQTSYTPPGQPIGTYAILTVSGTDVGVVYSAYKSMKGGKWSGVYTAMPAGGPFGYNDGSGPYVPPTATIEVIE